MKIAIGNDHTAIELKRVIVPFLSSKGARVVGSEIAKMIVEEWLNAEFEGGRHAARVGMIAEIEETGALQAAELS